MRNVLSSMTRRQLTMVLTALLTFAFTGSLIAQPGAWDHLGTKEIEGKADHDTIKCRGKDEYRALQFRVSGAAVQFDRIVVEYGNHNRKAYPFRILVPPNGSSPVLDLVGGHRDITKVEFWYQKASWGKKPEVRLFGRR